MTGFAIGMSSIDRLPQWAVYMQNGLVSAAVGFVALAAFKLSTKLLPDKLCVLIGITCACLAIDVKGFAWLYPIMMVGGGSIYYVSDTFVSWKKQSRLAESSAAAMLHVFDEEQVLDADGEQASQESADAEGEVEFGFQYGTRTSYVLLSLWMLLLVLSVYFRSAVTVPPMNVFSTMYFVGSIIFGGGPVVIPLLQGYVVSGQWMSTQEFLVGLALINCLPGPNFNIGAYCGALALRQSSPYLGAFLGYVGIFLPGLLLMASLLPFWREHRAKPFVHSIFKGVNAAAVGLVIAAVYILADKSIVDPNDPTRISNLVQQPILTSVAAFTFAMTGFMDIPAPICIILGGSVGMVQFALNL